MAKRGGADDAGEESRIDRTEIIDTNVVEELKNSFLEYSMSVIVARALPDVRDGLKPVHRRILYSLYEQGMRPGTPYKKCARVVGDTMGKYHPHGDSAIYESLVRMAQDFSLRLPLVDGHGNFGSLDDGPAASRYTECRMANSALAMTNELSEDTVDFRPNYDSTEREPSVMPAAFPNLLVNGTTGIAVGMATNMPPHNLDEVVNGLKAMLGNPKITLDEMMVHIPGPDLPTGGVIICGDGVREAYSTGRGSFRMRASASIEDVSARRKGIVVTALPYTIGPEKVIAKIKEMIANKRLTGVADVKDYTDRKRGMRLVIEVKTGFNPSALLDELYRTTPLEENFGVNNVALVDGQPRVLDLLSMCRHYLDHRLEVVRRRTQYRLAKAEARAHIVEGLVKALANIDEVVALLKSSKDPETARTKLRKSFELSEIQANHILEMPLRRLTGLEVTKLKEELKELKTLIGELKKILGSPKLLADVVSSELDQAAAAYGTSRRTKLLGSVANIDSALEIPDEPCKVVLTAGGGLGRVKESDAKRGAKPARGGGASIELHTTARAQLAVVTTLGRIFRIPVVELPQLDGKTVKGVTLREFADLAPNENIAGLINGTGVIAIGTRLGAVKRILASNLPKTNGMTIIGLRSQDTVVGAVELSEADAESARLVFVTSDAQLLHTEASEVRTQGASGSGMAGMKLSEDAQVIWFSAHTADSLKNTTVYTTTETGAWKKTPLAEYPVKGRAGAGVRCQTLRKAEHGLAAAFISESTVWGTGSNGAVVTLSGESAKRDASGGRDGDTVYGFGCSE